MTVSISGLQSVVYPTADLAAAKAWWSALLGVEPYFDEPYYVGFSLNGYELGLLPNAPLEDGAVAYWGVANVDVALGDALAAGATEHTPATDVGEGIITATARTPQGSLVGFIYNPYFKLPNSGGSCPIPGMSALQGMFGMVKAMIAK